MANPTEKPVAIKEEVCLDMGDMYMNNAYEGTDPADDAYEPRSATDDTTDQAIANNHINSAYEGKESVDDNTNQAKANHSSSCEFEKCERLKSVYDVKEPYTCGGCERLFTSICLLHEHIGVHGLGGSYHYNNRTRTAFPKYDNICCMNHADRTCEILGNRPELTNISNGEYIAEKEKVENNKASHGTKSFQGMCSDGSEKAEDCVDDNSVTDSTLIMYVKTGKDNSGLHTDLYEVGDSETNEIIWKRPELQKAGNDKCIEENIGVKCNEKMTCVKTKKARTGDGKVMVKLPLKRKSECFNTSRGENGRFKKAKSMKKKNNTKQTELCSDQNTEISSDRKTEIGSDQMTGDQMTEIGRDETIEIGNVQKTEIGSGRKNIIDSDLKTEICNDRETNIGSQKKIIWMGIDSDRLAKGRSDSKMSCSELRSEFQNCICFQCKLVFQSESVLKSHLEKHEGRLVCDCCSESFPSLTDFEKHVLYGEGKSIKAVDIPYCSYCNMMFTEIKGLKAHICVSAEDVKRKRQAIRNSTGTINKKHKQKVLQYIPIHKDKKSKQTKSEETMNNRAKIKCEICSEEFENDYFLIMHKTVHTHPYKCSRCSLHFISEFDRDQHRTSCINLDCCWTCHICGKRFRSSSGLASHKDIHRTLQDEKCKLCGAAFKSKVNLLKHEKRCPALGKREKKFSCELCDSKFYEKAPLKSHMSTVHSDRRPFVCELCGGTYKSLAVLRVHRRIHSEYRGYICKTCGVSFKEQQSWKRHCKIHEESMKMCTYCGKTFHELWNLKAHVRQHTGEKPYKCDLCGQGFTHNVSRKNHMSKCHKNLN